MSKWTSFYLAERGGFEPPVNFEAHTAFRERHLQPLGHLSVPWYILPYEGVNAAFVYMANCYTNDMNEHERHTPHFQSDDPLAIAALILGAVSFTGLGFITGVPAIILASVALVRKTRSRGLSLAGLIMGIVSTVISIAVVIFFILLVILRATGAQGDPGAPVPSKPQPYSQERV